MIDSSVKPLFRILESTENKYVFYPLYSPEIAPIEKYFSISEINSLKKMKRKIYWFTEQRCWKYNPREHWENFMRPYSFALNTLVEWNWKYYQNFKILYLNWMKYFINCDVSILSNRDEVLWFKYLCNLNIRINNYIKIPKTFITFVQSP